MTVGATFQFKVMKITESIKTTIYLITAENEAGFSLNYERHGDGNWYHAFECALPELVFDENLIQTLEKAFQEYHKNEEN